MASNLGSDPFDGLDASEREIMEREIREGRLHLLVETDPAKRVRKPRLLSFSDSRDMRDPLRLGDRLLHERKKMPNAPLSRIYDSFVSEVEV